MSPEDNNPFDPGQAIGAARSLALLASRRTGDLPQVAEKMPKLFVLISGGTLDLHCHWRKCPVYGCLFGGHAGLPSPLHSRWDGSRPERGPVRPFRAL